eukprot:Skav221291  [mRNA]  locus=scaffold2775:273765:276856:+ [translate_table: standard]
MRIRPKWKCIDSLEKIDEYLDHRFCRTPGFWSCGPGRGVYTDARQQEQAALPALFSACRWLLRGMMTAPKAIRFYHAFVETMGADGMGADGQAVQIPLLCWEPAN